MKEPALYITVGIPGCGKSTQAERMLIDDTVDIVVSSDKIREELTGDATNQGANNDVFTVMHRRVRAALSAGMRVLVDATNLRPEYRKTLMSFADEFGVPAFAIIFAVSRDLSTCEDRNKGRDRVVPVEVMARFHRYFVDDCKLTQLATEGWKVVSAYSTH